jgi:serine/threonine protein kinase
MRKDLLDQVQQDIIRDEISILSQLDHDNIINHIESFEDDRYLYIVMESMTDAKELAHLIEYQNNRRKGDQRLMVQSLFKES